MVRVDEPTSRTPRSTRSCRRSTRAPSSRRRGSRPGERARVAWSRSIPTPSRPPVAQRGARADLDRRDRDVPAEARSPPLRLPGRDLSGPDRGAPRARNAARSHGVSRVVCAGDRAATAVGDTGERGTEHDNRGEHDVARLAHLRPPATNQPTSLRSTAGALRSRERRDRRRARARVAGQAHRRPALRPGALSGRQLVRRARNARRHHGASASPVWKCEVGASVGGRERAPAPPDGAAPRALGRPARATATSRSRTRAPTRSRGSRSRAERPGA